MYRQTKPVDWCQCCTRGVALTDFEGSSDFFGNYNTPEVIHPTGDTSCFHIYLSPYFTNYAVSICKQTEIIPQDLLFAFVVI